MNYSGYDEGIIKKLLRKISKLEGVLKDFANKDNWIIDYTNYNDVWGEQSNPITKAEKALEDEE